MDLVPRDHLVHRIRDLVRERLDLGANCAAYEVRRRCPPYHPGLMTALLMYAYSRGMDSSRRIERAWSRSGLLLRGLENVTGGGWSLLCAVQSLLQLAAVRAPAMT